MGNSRTEAQGFKAISVHQQARKETADATAYRDSA
jgi:hypothetical protein